MVYYRDSDRKSESSVKINFTNAFSSCTKDSALDLYSLYLSFRAYSRTSLQILKGWEVPAQPISDHYAQLGGSVVKLQLTLLFKTMKQFWPVWKKCPTGYPIPLPKQTASLIDFRKQRFYLL